MEEKRRRRFRIPNADVVLDEVEVRIVHTRQFQRLFHLRQLGLAYLVYPGATHTRGVHSIETLYQATRILEALRTRHTIEPADDQAIRLAALLHDIGHIPFSHTLEDEHKVLKKHDGKKRIDEAFALLLAELGDIDDGMRNRIERAKDILIRVSAKDMPEENIYIKDWRSDLVGNTICADLLAYINTDAMWSGIDKQSGHYRIYDYFRIQKEEIKKKDKETNEDKIVCKRERLCIELTKDGILRTDVVSAILDILGMRYTLTERILFHHAKCTASAMLARAARLCGLSDEDCACIKEDLQIEDPSRRRNLLRIGDEVFLDLLEERAYRLLEEKDDEEGYKGVLDLVQQLRSRNLHQRIFKVSRRTKDEWNDGSAVDRFSEKWREKEKVEEALCSVEDRFNLPRGSLVLWCSDSKAGTKLVRVNVIWSSEDGANPVELRSDQVKLKFPTVWDRVKAVEDQYNDLWCFWVALDRRYISKAVSIVEALAEKFEVPCDRMFKEKYLQARIDPTGERKKLSELVETTFCGIKDGILEEILDAVPALDGEDNRIDDRIILQKARTKIDELIGSPVNIRKKQSDKKPVGKKRLTRARESAGEEQLPIPGSDDDTEE